MDLTRNERQLLLVVLENYLEGMTDAKERMIEDTYTLGDFDTFTETLQQHDIDALAIESIKQKVLDDD